MCFRKKRVGKLEVKVNDDIDGVEGNKRGEFEQFLQCHRSDEAPKTRIEKLKKEEK
jgi:hypothetical protein